MIDVLALFSMVVYGLILAAFEQMKRSENHSQWDNFQLGRRRPVFQQFLFKLRSILVWGNSDSSYVCVTFDPVLRLTFPDSGWHAVQFHYLRGARHLDRHGVVLAQFSPARARRQGPPVLAIAQGSGNT